jgi:hypothetical protein
MESVLILNLLTLFNGDNIVKYRSFVMIVKIGLLVCCRGSAAAAIWADTRPIRCRQIDLLSAIQQSGLTAQPLPRCLADPPKGSVVPTLNVTYNYVSILYKHRQV